jgi:hypothetical protein
MWCARRIGIFPIGRAHTSVQAMPRYQTLYNPQRGWLRSVARGGKRINLADLRSKADAGWLAPF